DTARNRVGLLASVGIVTGASMSLVWLMGGDRVLRGGFTLGSLVAFYNYVLLFNNPLQWFGQFSDWTTRRFSSAKRIFDVLDTPRESYSDPAAIRATCLPGRIDVRHVFFGYDKTKPVLRGLSLSVAAGEMVGIVGRSGAGKTTLVNLVCR